MSVPQHGRGRKHERPIILADWQRAIVDADPYSYPRHFFSTMSTDILHIMGDALDRVGVEWRFTRYNSISVARRDSVVLMDDHIGPKR